MAFNQILATPRITVNNTVIEYKPNSLSYTEGLGEQKMRTQSSGGNNVSTVYATDVESSISDIKFEMEPTEGNIEKIREWKLNANANTITIESAQLNGTFTRSFDNVALVNNYEVNTKSDGMISLEFKGTATA